MDIRDSIFTRCKSGLRPLFLNLDVFGQRDSFGKTDRFGQRDIYSTKQKNSSRCLPGVDKDPIMFQNLETNRPNTHAKFKLDWFSGFLKKL